MQQLNTPIETMLANADANLSRKLPMFLPHGEGDELCIVGGGPSLPSVLPSLRMRFQRGAKLWALNGAHDWLLDHHFIPDAMVVLDARPETAQFVYRASRRPVYYIAAQCDPVVFDALDGRKVAMWVGYAPGIEAIAAKHDDKPIVIVGGGNTVGLKALAMAVICKYRSVHLYGFDSCYSVAHHAYPQALNDGEQTMEVDCYGRKFICSGWMVRQAEDFQTDYINAVNAGIKVHVHGDGLIPHLAKHIKENTHA